MRRARTGAARADKILDRGNFDRPHLNATWKALAPLDKVAVDVERAWGSVDRLLSLVPVDLASKFGSAMSKMTLAVESVDGSADTINEAERRIDVLIRGYAALVKAAEEAGHKPLDRSRVWVLDTPEGLVVVGMSDADAHMAAAHLEEFKRVPEDKPRVYSIEELIRIARMFSPTFDKIKEAFPGATIIETREPGQSSMPAPPKPARVNFAVGDSLDGVLPPAEANTEEKDEW